MVGSIDPRCEQIRGTHWPDKVVWLIGTRVAEAILASGLQPHQRPDIWMQAIRSNLTKLLCHGGRPHMGPRFAGTTAIVSPIVSPKNTQRRILQQHDGLRIHDAAV